MHTYIQRPSGIHTYIHTCRHTVINIYTHTYGRHTQACRHLGKAWETRATYIHRQNGRHPAITTYMMSDWHTCIYI